MTVIEWLIEECNRRLALERESPEPPGKTFIEKIDDWPGRGYKDSAAKREYEKRRYGQAHGR